MRLCHLVNKIGNCILYEYLMLVPNLTNVYVNVMIPIHVIMIQTFNTIIIYYKIT